MKLLEEIKRVEEQAENMKKNAEIEGQKLIGQTRAQGENDIVALDNKKDAMLDRKLNETQIIIDREIKKLDNQHEHTIKKIKESYSRNKEKAIKKIQDLILTWPSSR